MLYVQECTTNICLYIFLCDMLTNCGIMSQVMDNGLQWKTCTILHKYFCLIWVSGLYDNGNDFFTMVEPSNIIKMYSIHKLLLFSFVNVPQNILNVYVESSWKNSRNLFHYDDVIMTTTASQITSLAVVYSIFIQAPIKENIKAPRHWPFCGEFAGTGEFPAQRASNAENVSIWWRHHVNVFVECLLDNSNASKAYILVSENSTSIICGQQESESRPRRWSGTIWRKTRSLFAMRYLQTNTVMFYVLGRKQW